MNGSSLIVTFTYSFSSPSPYSAHALFSVRGIKLIAVDICLGFIKSQSLNSDFGDFFVNIKQARRKFIGSEIVQN